MKPKEILFGPWVDCSGSSEVFPPVAGPRPKIAITPDMFKSEPNEMVEVLDRKVQAAIKLDMAIRTLEHGHKLLTEAAPEFNSPALFTIGEPFGQQIQILKGALK